MRVLPKAPRHAFKWSMTPGATQEGSCTPNSSPEPTASMVHYSFCAAALPCFRAASEDASPAASSTKPTANKVQHIFCAAALPEFRAANEDTSCAASHETRVNLVAIVFLGYEVQTILASHLYPSDLVSLASVNSDLRRELTEQGRPKLTSAKGKTAAPPPRSTQHWRNLLGLTRLYCEEKDHGEILGFPLPEEGSDIKASAWEPDRIEFTEIRRQLRVRFPTNICAKPGCTKAVCFECYWYQQSMSRGVDSKPGREDVNGPLRRSGGRGRDFCKACYSGELITVRLEEQEVLTTREALQEEKHWCACGAKVFCSDCFDEIDIFGRPYDPIAEQRWKNIRDTYVMRYYVMRKSYSAYKVRCMMDSASPQEFGKPKWYSPRTCYGCKGDLQYGEIGTYECCRLCSLPVKPPTPSGRYADWRRGTDVVLSIDERKRDDKARDYETLEYKLRTVSAKCFEELAESESSCVRFTYVMSHRLTFLDNRHSCPWLAEDGRDSKEIMARLSDLRGVDTDDLLELSRSPVVGSE